MQKVQLYAKRPRDVTMDSFEIVYETPDNIKVKEEPDDTKLFEINSVGWKCGEVVLDDGDNFTLVCAVCLQRYNEMHSFGLHIRNKHMNFHPQRQIDQGTEKMDPFSSITHCRNPSTSTEEDNEHEESDTTSKPGQLQWHNAEVVETDKRPRVKLEDVELLDKSNESSDDEEPLQKKFLRARQSLVGRTQSKQSSTLKSVVDAIKNDGHVDLREVTGLFPDSNKTSDNQKEDIAVRSDYKRQNLQFRESCVFGCRIYRSKRTLLAHLRQAHSDKIKPASEIRDARNQLDIISAPITMICKFCKEKFECVSALTRHVETHTQNRQFSCAQCEKIFDRAAKLKSHMKTHTGERPHQCPHCPKAFSHRPNLNCHIRAHLGIKNHSCNYCDKRFVTSTEKVLHERTHTGEKPYQCEECGKRFNSHVRLSEHWKRHKNIRNYKCEVCDKGFYDSALLKDHMTAHTNERRFTCNICSQKFTKKTSLRIHQELHSGVKKYICGACGKTFAQYAGLYSHRKSHGASIGSEKPP